MRKHIKSYWSNYLSIGAISCSIVTIITVHPSTSELGLDYMGIIVGILSLLVTLLLGWQIWSIISIDKKINDKVEYLNKEINDKVNSINVSLNENINKAQESLQISGARSSIATLYKAEAINLNVCLITGRNNFLKAIHILKTIIEYAVALKDRDTLKDATKILVESKNIMDDSGINPQDFETIYNFFLESSRIVLENLPASDDQVPQIYQMIKDVQKYLNNNEDSMGT